MGKDREVVFYFFSQKIRTRANTVAHKRWLSLIYFTIYGII